tara:strand:- start:4148 stop:4312 length:165 start_codon:yes stop_codon:yes gene_type:complete
MKKSLAKIRIIHNATADYPGYPTVALWNIRDFGNKKSSYIGIINGIFIGIFSCK